MARFKVNLRVYIDGWEAELFNKRQQSQRPVRAAQSFSGIPLMRQCFARRHKETIPSFDNVFVKIFMH